MAREDYAAAALLAGTAEEQRAAVASALKGARMEARVEGWLAAAELIDRAAERVPEADDLMRATKVGMGAAAKLLREMLPDVMGGRPLSEVVDTDAQ